MEYCLLLKLPPDNLTSYYIGYIAIPLNFYRMRLRLAKQERTQTGAVMQSEANIL